MNFNNAKYAGIACGIKNTGVGNGMIDDSEVKIQIVSDKKVIIDHGWTEMGQGSSYNGYPDTASGNRDTS